MSGWDWGMSGMLTEDGGPKLYGAYRGTGLAGDPLSRDARVFMLVAGPNFKVLISRTKECQYVHLIELTDTIFIYIVL